MSRYRILVSGQVVWSGNSLREARTTLLATLGGTIQRRVRGGNWASVP